jgi:hypothetical protein
MGTRRKQNDIPDEAKKKVEKYLSKVSSKYFDLMTRVFDSKATQKDAIKAKCYDCCGFEDIPLNVHGCKSYTCPLWPLRPVSEAKGDRND